MSDHLMNTMPCTNNNRPGYLAETIGTAYCKTTINEIQADL